MQPLIIPLASSDPAEGTVSPSEVRFDPQDWQAPRTVTVTGVDDTRADGARTYQIRVGPASGGDARYTVLPATGLALRNRDDELGFFVEPKQPPLQTTESGGVATFTVALNRAPAATVRLPLGSSDEGEATVSPAELVFSVESWQTPQVVTVTGIDDPDRDGDQAFRVMTGPATSADPAYAGVDPEDIEIGNRDDEIEPVVAQIVSGDLMCYGSYVVQQIAVDVNGKLHLAMTCYRGQPVNAPNVFVVSSQDGGRTFGLPVDTGMRSFEAQIVAGAPGVVLVAGRDSTGLLVARSDDGGATWPTARVLANGGNLLLAAAGDRVVARAVTQYLPLLFISEDGGLTFAKARSPENPALLGVDGQATDRSIWIFERGTVFRFWQSRDGGATFEPRIAFPDFHVDQFAVGSGTIFAVGPAPRLLVLSGDPLSRREVDGLPPAPPLPSLPRTVVADAAGNAVVLESEGGDLLARRLPAGAETFLPPRTLGPTQSPASGVALSENAIAVGRYAGGKVWVSVETWP